MFPEVFLFDHEKGRKLFSFSVFAVTQLFLSYINKLFLFVKNNITYWRVYLFFLTLPDKMKNMNRFPHPHPAFLKGAD